MAFSAPDFEDQEIGSTPSILPDVEFEPETDARMLFKAAEDIETKRDKIMKIVTDRSGVQLMAVEKEFENMHGEDLKSWLKKELRGNFLKVVLGRFFGPRGYQAYLLRNAMAGMVTDDRAMIDTICTKDKQEMEMVRRAYETIYERDMIEDIKSKTSGDLSRILIALARADRGTDPVDEELAASDAQTLHDAGVGSWGTDEDTFNEIFAGRSFPQLLATITAYKEQTGETMETVIKNEMDNELKDVFLTLVRYISHPITYYSEELYRSMKGMLGMGSDDRTLIRTVLSRCEIDLGEIMKTFEEVYETTLDEAIKKETSGNYRKIMLMIVNPPVTFDWNNKLLAMSNGDLMFINNQHGILEVHILTAVSNYQTFGLHAETQIELHNTREWHFQVLSNNDVMCIKIKAPTSKLQILTAESNYQAFGLQSKIELNVEDVDLWHFQVISDDDLMCIKNKRLPDWKIEIHVLTANSNYEEFRLHTQSPLDGDLEDELRFEAISNGDLMCIKKSGCDSEKTEVNILGAEDSYQSFSLQTATALDMDLPNAFQFEAMSNGDLMCIKDKPPTGSNMTEVHILSMESSYQTFVLQTGTALQLN